MKGSILSLAWAAGASAARVTLEADVTTFSSRSWVVGDRVSEDETIELEFWLKHDAADLTDFHDTLMALSTPGSKRYGEWLTHAEVAEKLAPSHESMDAVLGFCVEELGARDVHVNKHRSVVSVVVPARVAEAALSTRLHHHSHAVYSMVDVVRAVESYSLPDSVARHVSVVGELVRFPRMRFAAKELVTTELLASAPNASVAAEWSACGASNAKYANPHVLAARYGFEFPLTEAAAGNSLGLAEFQNQYYDDADLAAFSEACSLATTVSVSKVVGGNSPARCAIGLQPCIESLLDVEYAGAVAGAIPLEVYYSSTYSLLDYANALADADAPPLVNSVSYGNDEAQQTGADFMESANAAFMKLGAMGVSLLFAAGDQGVWGREGVGRTYHPDFPAGSPYVTSVGGTDFAEASTIGEETAWASGGSGFSDEFAAPDFQKDAVARYLATANGLPREAMYDAAGRAYPDVSALAGQVNSYFISYKQGTFAAVAGTSAACPVVAAMMAQLNNARLAQGKPALGFLNPFLYAAKATAFNDVTTGTTSGGLTGGFPASKGWDAATGFGSINFPNLKQQALDL